MGITHRIHSDSSYNILLYNDLEYSLTSSSLKVNPVRYKALVASSIQCISVDSASFVIYPEIKATEVPFQSLKTYLFSFYFRIDNETGRIQ